MQEKQVMQEHVEHSRYENQKAKLNTRNPEHMALLMAIYGLHLPPRIAVNILAEEGIETAAETVTNKMHALRSYKLQRLRVNKLVRAIAEHIKPILIKELEQAMPAESLKICYKVWSKAYKAYKDIQVVLNHTDSN